MLALAICLSLTVPEHVAAYPPITCGQLSNSSTNYIVRTHGPSCDFAFHGIKVFWGHQHGPRGYICKAYGVAILCVRAHHGKVTDRGKVPDRQYLYFSADPVSQ